MADYGVHRTQAILSSAIANLAESSRKRVGKQLPYIRTRAFA